MDARDDRGWMAKVLDSDDNQGPSGGLDAFSAKVILLSLGSVSFVVPSVVFHHDAKVLEDKVSSCDPGAVVGVDLDIHGGLAQARSREE